MRLLPFTFSITIPAARRYRHDQGPKLEEGRQSSMFDDHPASAERAQHIRDRMSADGIK